MTRRSTPATALDVFVKIARAAQRGNTSPEELALLRRAGFDIINVEIAPNDIKTEAWFFRNFRPETGSIGRETRFRTLPRMNGRPARYYDAYAYTRPLVHGTLLVTYWATHQHYRYELYKHGETQVYRHGKRVWRCVDCRVQLSTTQARQQNLVVD